MAASRLTEQMRIRKPDEQVDSPMVQVQVLKTANVELREENLEVPERQPSGSQVPGQTEEHSDCSDSDSK